MLSNSSSIKRGLTAPTANPQKMSKLTKHKKSLSSSSQDFKFYGEKISGLREGLLPNFALGNRILQKPPMAAGLFM